ncbi:MAG TPA: terminase small subunit, partial [Armatimonadota bacterium]|nr:terminase small subunit [Armatimonadota bacterium]
MRELSLSAAEILQRLTEQARGDIGEFLQIDEETGDYYLDLRAAKQSGATRLIKKVSRGKDSQRSIEMYDSQSALLALAKRYGLFPERVTLDVDELDEAISRGLALLADREEAAAPEPAGNPAGAPPDRADGGHGEG